MTLDIDDVSNYHKNLISINFHFVPHTEQSVLEDQSCTDVQGNNRLFFWYVSCGTENYLFKENT
jgi:hypothetical protein